MSYDSPCPPPGRGARNDPAGLRADAGRSTCDHARVGDPGTRARPPRDDDEQAPDDVAEPLLADEAPSTPDADADLPPDAAALAFLHDEAQASGSDLGEVAPDPDAEADLRAAAPRGPDESGEAPAPLPRRPTAATSPAPRGFTGAWREPVLPPRRVARRSARDELMADLPPAAPPPAPGGLQIKVSPRPGEEERGAPGDPADVLPPEVRIKVLEARSRRDESMAAAVAREARRTRTIVVAMTLLGLFTGGVTGSLLLPTALAALVAALVDAGLAGAAGFVIHRAGGGALRGLAAFGAAAVVSAGVKVALGAITLQGMADLGAFAVLMGVTLGSTLLGGFLGQRLDALVFEDGA